MTERPVGLLCAKCRTELPGDSRFCNRCGAAVPVPAAEPAPADVAQLRERLQTELGKDVVLGEELGRGPLTICFRGIEKDRAVCVNVVPPELAEIERGVVDRLLRAARAASRLKHPRIVPVLRVAAGDRLAWYVTRQEDGETLEALLEREYQLPVERVVNIAGHIATALGAAHELDLPHGALTPAAILVGPGDAVSVRDFGLSRASRTGAGAPGADPVQLNYLAPELDAAAQANPLSAAGVSGIAIPADPAADQYALGVMVYQMLTGNLPFYGTTPEEVRREHRESPVPPLAVSRPDVPVALTTVVERALAKNPVDRFPGVVRFATALRQAVQGRTNPTRGVSKRNSDTLYFPENSPARPVSIKHALLACAATLVLILAAWRSRSDAWVSTAGNGRLVAPRPVRELPPSTSTLGGTTVQQQQPPAAQEEASAQEGGTEPNRPERSRPAPARAERSRGETRSGAGMGFITVGSNPQGTIYINNIPASTNPVRNWAAPAGRVNLRFETTDTSGEVRTQDMTINLTAGDTVNLGRIRLGTP